MSNAESELLIGYAADVLALTWAWYRRVALYGHPLAAAALWHVLRPLVALCYAHLALMRLILGPPSPGRRSS